MKLIKSILSIILLVGLFEFTVDAAGWKTYGVDYFSATYSSGHLLDVEPSRVSNSILVKKKKGGKINSELYGDDGKSGGTGANADHEWADNYYYIYNNTTVNENVYLEYDNAVEYLDSSGNPQYLTLRIYPVTYSSSKPWSMSINRISVAHLFFDEQYTGLQYRFYNSGGQEVGFTGIISSSDLDTHEGMAFIENSAIKNFYLSSNTTLAKVKTGGSHSNSDNNPFKGLKSYTGFSDSEGKSNLTYFFGKHKSGDVLDDGTVVSGGMQKVWLEVESSPSNRLNIGYATAGGRRGSNLSNRDIPINYYINGNLVRSYSTVPYSYFTLVNTSIYNEDGYTFKGWYSSSTLDETKKYGMQGSCNGSSINIYGFKSPNSYNLVINPNGGKLSNWDTGDWQTTSITKQFIYTQSTPFCIYDSLSLFEDLGYSSQYKVVSIPYRYGYEFGGWSSDNGSITSGNYYNSNYSSYNFSGNYIGNVEVKAIWIPVYEITLDSQSASYQGTACYFEKYNHSNYATYNNTGVGACSYCCKNLITHITLPSKTGYIFGGYYSQRNGLGTQYIDSQGKILSGNTSFNANTTLYAYWVPIKYNIVYDKGLTNN